MKKYLITFLNYNNDYNTDEDRERLILFKKFNSERNKKYCLKHGFEYIEVDETVYKIPHLFKIDGMPEFNMKQNNHFARWQFFRDCIDNGRFKEDDIINHHDADVFIKNTDVAMVTNKSFTYAIDSGNTHCFGVFSLKVNEFGNKLINLMLSKERFDKLTKIKFYKENEGGDVFFYWGDQQAYYIACGIKCHSWVPFIYFPNNGFYSYPTEHVAFSLEELLSNVEIMPVEYNVTHLLDESGQHGRRNDYDIVHTTKEKTIFRHFAGGQLWRFEQYTKEFLF